MNIEFKEGAVCYAGNRQWHFNESVKPYNLVSNMQGACLETYKGALSFGDFQLNTIKQGDYIAASELDTEKKYNDAVEVFKLFGYSFDPAKAHYPSDFEAIIKNGVGSHLYVSDMGFLRLGFSFDDKSKVTFNQLMAIGKLKRMMNERDNAVLNSSEETELKSRAMASELNIKSNDEWPQVGDEVASIYSCTRGVVKAKSKEKVCIITDKGALILVNIDNIKKPKSKEDLLIEELQTKLVENNAVDNWMLAANIINGDIEGLTYKGGSDD